jgi:hypothetical protein
MSDNRILTDKEENAVKALIAAQTNVLLEHFHANTIEAITTNQNTTVDAIQRIIETVNANQEAIIATAQSGRSTEKANKKWQFMMALVPVALSAFLGIGLSVFGYFIWKSQVNIQQRIDQNNTRLATRLSFTDEFYKRRFAAYENFYGQILVLRKGMRNVDDTKSVTQAMDVLITLDNYDGADRMYLSDKITQQMDILWATGIDALRYPGNRESLAAFEAQVKDLEKRMKEDLWTAPFD